MFKINKNKLIKALVIALELLAMAIFIYLLILPLWPAIVYKFSKPDQKVDWQNSIAIKEQTSLIINHLPEESNSLSVNRIIIPKISVNASIIESKEEEYALNRGSWRLPESSTPEKGGNTVITGHRFKYLPPSNLTFYLLDKLIIGDIISVIWQGQEFLYRAKEIKIVSKNDLSVLDQSSDSILTLFTCDPIYSQKNRLVIIGELIEK